MNSALQCLSANEQLTRYFLSHAHLQDLNTDNQHGAGGQLAVAYGRLLEQMWFGSGIEGQDNKASKKEEGDPHVACTALVPHAFKRVFCSFRPIFYEEVQQDAQEFLTQFLDGLAEDTKLPPPVI